MINFDESNVILVNNYGTNCENIALALHFFFFYLASKKSNSYFFSFPFFSLVEKTALTLGPHVHVTILHPPIN